MHSIHFETDDDLIDKNYYPDLISRYNKARDKDLKNCSHEHWSKHCKTCNRIVSSELTDEQFKDYLKLKQD